MAAAIEIPEWINETTIERAHRRANLAHRSNSHGFAQKGWRAATARDSRLLKALEGGAEVLQAIQERQRGRTMRDPGTEYGQRVDLTEYTLWREAYKCCDRGEPSENLMWIYGAAAELAGY